MLQETGYNRISRSVKAIAHVFERNREGQLNLIRSWRSMGGQASYFGTHDPVP